MRIAVMHRATSLDIIPRGEEHHMTSTPHMSRHTPTLRAAVLSMVVGLATCLLANATDANATTYFVDPTAGSNSNNGTSPSTPWMNPPGTRTASDSGFFSASWGGITTSNKIKCGDVILLR